MEPTLISLLFWRRGSNQIHQNEAIERELSALKAVIKCIEDHKLEDQYPLAPLQKQILYLEKAKADKKRATEVSKPQPKRARANAGIAPRNTNIGAKMTDRYAAPSQYIYAHPGPADMYMGTTVYNVGPIHGAYFGTGYQYQAPYLH